jgi:hypothetical protein
MESPSPTIDGGVTTYMPEQGGSRIRNRRRWSLGCGRGKQKSAEFEHETISAWLDCLIIPLDREIVFAQFNIAIEEQGQQN